MGIGSFALLDLLNIDSSAVPLGCSPGFPGLAFTTELCPYGQTLWHLAVPKVFCMNGFDRITQHRNVGACCGATHDIVLALINT